MANQGPSIDDDELLAMFDKIDLDKSHTIELNEIETEYRKKGFTYSEIKVIFDTFDVDKDGKITKQEYQQRVGLVSAWTRKKAVWRRIFEEADKNQDGTLSYEELIACLKKYDMDEAKTPEKILNYVKTIDVNGDQKIDYEEFLNWLMGPTVKDEELMAMFDGIDTDKSGSIDLNEMRVEYEKKGFNLAEIQKIFEDFDANKDGVITKDEYRKKLGVVDPKTRAKAGWRMIFDDADQDKNGTLSIAEFKKCLEKYNFYKEMSTEDFKQFVKGIDTNGDDTIDYQEFVNWMVCN